MNDKEPQKHELKPRLRFPEFRDTVEWKEKKLKDVVSPAIREVAKPSSTYFGLGVRSHGKGTFRKPDQAPEKNSMDRLYLVHRNDLIVNITFAWEGAIAIANDSDHGCYVSHRFPTYVFDSSVATPDFFRYVITNKAFVHTLGLISPGGAGRNRVLNKNDFINISILLPAITEQKKIADCLYSIDERISPEIQKLDALKSHKKGLMNQLFPAEGKTIPRLRFREFQEAGNWDEKQLKDVAPLQRGFDLPSDQIKAGQVPVVYSNGVQNFHNIGMAKAPGITTGRSGTIGKIHFIQEGEYWPHNTSLWVTSFKGNFPKFIYYLFESIGISRFSSGSGIPTLNRNDVHAFRACLPASIIEQQKIADCLTSVDDLIVIQSQKINALKAHKKGLTQQLFPALDEAAV